jgi:hypothetical protein
MRVIAVFVSIAALVAACAAPPDPGPSERPATPSPTPPAAATRAQLLVQARVDGSCGAIGGCAYFARIDGTGGSWEAELEPGRGGGMMLGGDGLPASLPEGAHTVTLWSRPVSDLVENGARSMGPVHAECTADFAVGTGQAAVTILGAFDDRVCEIEVRAGASL